MLLMANFSLVELCFIELYMSKSGVWMTNDKIQKHLNEKQLFTGFTPDIFKELF